MAQRLIGIDAGTTVIKAVAFSLDGEELYHHSLDNAVDHPEPGYAEQSMAETWEKTAAVLQSVVRDLDDDDEIVGLGVTAQGDGCWMVDEAGEPIRPAILWSDSRASDIVGRWKDEGIDQEIYDICGGGIFPGSSLTILQWLKENEPETLDQIDTVFWCKDWLKYKLTDTMSSDPTDMSLPYLDIESCDYSDEVLDIAGLPEISETLPPLKNGDEVIGEITGTAAEQTGVPEGTPVVSGFFDVPASAIGSGASKAGDGSSVVGTTSLNQTLLDEPYKGSTPVGITVGLGVDDKWCRFMASMTGTPNLDWALEEIMAFSEFNLVEMAVSEIPVGADGVIYHPFLSSAGERAPFSDSNARAQFMGLSQEHTQAHLVRAVYEGISLAMRDCYEHLPYDADEIFLSGGGAKSDFWCQLFADALDASIAVPRGSEFGAQGAAILAGIGVGVYDDLESAVDRTSAVDRSFEPRAEKAQQYDRWYDVYKEAYEATFDVWSQRAEAVQELKAMRASEASQEPSSLREGADDD
jgi:sugar (pentulose or hexulose) kinase